MRESFISKIMARVNDPDDTNLLGDCARIYAEAGYSVFPLKPGAKKPITQNGCKDATTDLDVIAKWWKKHPTANIGCATGSVSGIIVIDEDIDEVKGINGYLEMQNYERQHGALPETISAITGRGGYHLFYAYSGSDIGNRAGIIEGVDIRGEGGYVILPPSIHPNGNRYSWDISSEDMELARVNDRISDFLSIGRKQKKQHNAQQNTRFKLPDSIPEGQRNDILYHYACSLQAKGKADDEILSLIMEANNTRCSDPLPADEIETLINSALSHEKGKARDPLSRFHFFNDKGNPSGTIDDVIVDDVIDSRPMLNYAGIIYLYDDGWYMADDNKAVVKELISQRLYLKYKKYQNIAQIHNHILTKTRIMVSEEALNSYPIRWINFKNGMLDVETMKLHTHDPKYNALNQIPYPWIDEQPGKDSVTLRYLTDLIRDPDDLEMFLQFCGYCMTHDTSQQAFMIIHGNGGTGKSVLLRLLSKTIGRANICNIPLQAINGERFASAFLFGKLVNVYADLPSKDMAEVDALKTITGEDSVRAEIKGGAVFSFYPYCKLIFSANKIPKSRDDKTDAYYRRMRILRVNRRAKEIPDLEDKLEADIQSFIWLCVSALHRMYEAGKLLESYNSELETAQLYADTDSVQAFLMDKGYKITGNASDRVNRVNLYQEYERYCDAEGRTQSKYTTTGFYSNLRDKGCIINDNIRIQKQNNVRAVAGIKKEYTSESVPF